MDEKQREQFREAVERKNEEAEAASTEGHDEQLIDTDETQDTYSVRQKSTGHGKKTADKWNQ
jgi:hypothetical protein